MWLGLCTITRSHHRRLLYGSVRWVRQEHKIHIIGMAIDAQLRLRLIRMCMCERVCVCVRLVPVARITMKTLMTTTPKTTVEATAALTNAESVRFYLFAIVVNEIRKFLSQSEDHWQPKQTVLCCRRILNHFIHVLALVPCECVTYVYAARVCIK